MQQAEIHRLSAALYFIPRQAIWLLPCCRPNETPSLTIPAVQLKDVDEAPVPSHYVDEESVRVPITEINQNITPALIPEELTTPPEPHSNSLPAPESPPAQEEIIPEESSFSPTLPGPRCFSRPTLRPAHLCYLVFRKIHVSCFSLHAECLFRNVAFNFLFITLIFLDKRKKSRHNSRIIVVLLR